MDSTACAHQAHLTCTHAGRGCDCWCHTDYRRAEADQTSAEARAAELAGWGWCALAAALSLAAGALASSSRAAGVVLAVWACWPLWAAVTRWRQAADDREIAAWLGGAA